MYDLSFVSSTPRSNGPRIIFTTDAKHLNELDKRLRILAERTADHARKYCMSPDAEFRFPRDSADLFGVTAFGYNKCGFVTIDDGHTHFHIELVRLPQLHACTLTMKLLAHALAVPVDDGKISNQLQQVDLDMCCEWGDSNGYGHATGGYVSSRLLTWLKNVGKRAPADSIGVPIPEEVLFAMCDTWAAVAKEELCEWVDACSGRIAPDGRFILNCFGNACDLAIYPDEYREGDEFCRFDCHNLDSAAQQVTLLAGLAKMCELAREAEET